MYKIVNRKKLLATVVADIIGKTVFLPKRLFGGKHEIKQEEVRDILVIRTAYIGDVVMTIPILKPLKERFPGARVTFLTAPGAKGVLLNNPYVDEVVTYDPFWFYGSPKLGYLKFIREFRKRCFDLVIEARGDIREIMLLVWPLRARYKLSYDVGGGGFLLTHVVPYRGLGHKVEYHLDLARYLGCKTDDAEWGIYLTDDERRKVGDILAAHGIKGPFISVHPGSRLALKRWPADRYAALCDRLMEETGMPVVVLGTEGERPLVDGVIGGMRTRPVDLAGRLGIRELAGVLERSAVFICNDSAPMHIAAAMKTPTVAIFGPSKSIETAPWGKGHRVVEKDFPCRFTCDESTCRYDRFNACMTDIAVEDVMRAVNIILEGTLTR